MSAVAGLPAANADELPGFEIQSLDGRGNNRANPDWGRAGTAYSRVAPARYADGRSEMVAGPNSRMVSNRVHNDVHPNVPLTNAHWNGVLQPGQRLSGVGFIGIWNNRRNGKPARFSLNTTVCSVG